VNLNVSDKEKPSDAIFGFKRIKLHNPIKSKKGMDERKPLTFLWSVPTMLVSSVDQSRWFYPS
jgi:hypothetical protein